jgi:hypothetical protein
MALAIRFIPNAGRAVIYTPSGRTYNVTGPTVDIPFPDADAVATDQATRLMVVGATADRPAGGPDRIGWPPPRMYDTTLGEPIFLVPGSYPASWVDITGSPV